MKTVLTNIFLVKTSFERERMIRMDDFESEASTSSEINYFISENKLLIIEFEYFLEIIIKEKKKRIPQINYSSKHVAKFEIDDFKEGDAEDLMKLERFVNINAAAMIFPFIRENVAITTAKAGMSSIIVPVENFVDRYERKEKDKNEVQKNQLKKKNQTK